MEIKTITELRKEYQDYMSEQESDGSEKGDESIDKMIASLRADKKYSNFSDIEIEQVAVDILRRKAQEVVSTRISSYSTGGCPDEEWAVYSPEEILQMSQNGVNIPKEVVTWAQTLQDVDTVSYQVEGTDSLSGDTDTETVENETDDKAKLAVEKKVKAYISKSNEHEAAMQQDLQELNPLTSKVESIKDESFIARQKSIKKIEELTEEWKGLDGKIKKGSKLSDTEEKRYIELGGLLNGEEDNIVTEMEDMQQQLETFMTKVSDIKTSTEKGVQLGIETSETGKDLAQFDHDFDVRKADKFLNLPFFGVTKDMLYGKPGESLARDGVDKGEELREISNNINGKVTSHKMNKLVKFSDKYSQRIDEAVSETKEEMSEKFNMTEDEIKRSEEERLAKEAGVDGSLIDEVTQNVTDRKTPKTTEAKNKQEEMKQETQTSAGDAKKGGSNAKTAAAVIPAVNVNTTAINPASNSVSSKSLQGADQTQNKAKVQDITSDLAKDVTTDANDSANQPGGVDPKINTRDKQTKAKSKKEDDGKPETSDDMRQAAEKQTQDENKVVRKDEQKGKSANKDAKSVEKDGKNAKKAGQEAKKTGKELEDEDKQIQREIKETEKELKEAEAKINAFIADSEAANEEILALNEESAQQSAQPAPAAAPAAPSPAPSAGPNNQGKSNSPGSSGGRNRSIAPAPTPVSNGANNSSAGDPNARQQKMQGLMQRVQNNGSQIGTLQGAVLRKSNKLLAKLKTQQKRAEKAQKDSQNATKKHEKLKKTIGIVNKVMTATKIVGKVVMGVGKGQVITGTVMQTVGGVEVSTGTGLTTSGTTMIAIGTPMLSNPFTAAAGASLVASGTVMTTNGGILTSAGTASVTAGTTLAEGTGPATINIGNIINMVGTYGGMACSASLMAIEAADGNLMGVITNGVALGMSCIGGFPKVGDAGELVKTAAEAGKTAADTAVQSASQAAQQAQSLTTGLAQSAGDTAFNQVLPGISNGAISNMATGLGTDIAGSVSEDVLTEGFKQATKEVTKTVAGSILKTMMSKDVLIALGSMALSEAGSAFGGSKKTAGEDKKKSRSLNTFDRKKASEMIRKINRKRANTKSRANNQNRR